MGYLAITYLNPIPPLITIVLVWGNDGRVVVAGWALTE